MPDRGATRFKIRPGSDSDMQAVAALGAQVQNLHYAAHPDKFTAPDHAEIMAFIMNAIRQPNHRLIVAEGNGEVVGFALCERMERSRTAFRHPMVSLYVHQLAIDSSARRLGIGSALLDACEALAREVAATRIRLDSWTFNSDAHAFFAAQGFAPVNTIFERPLPL